MNKWDGIAFICLSLGLGIGFDAFDWLIPQNDLQMVIKFTLYGLGGYLLLQKGNWFSIKL